MGKPGELTAKERRQFEDLIRRYFEFEAYDPHAGGPPPVGPTGPGGPGVPGGPGLSPRRARRHWFRWRRGRRGQAGQPG